MWEILVVSVSVKVVFPSHVDGANAKLESWIY